MPPIVPPNIEVVDASQAEPFRNKSMAERVAMIDDANLTARAMMAAALRGQHTEWTEHEVQTEVVRRMTRAATRPSAASV